MDNPSFASWTRSSAFSLHLNQTAISNLVAMYDADVEVGHPRDPEYGFGLYSRSEWAYLMRRGLIAHTKYRDNYILTEPGEMVARLLKLAGFSNSYHGEGITGDHMVNTMDGPN